MKEIKLIGTSKYRIKYAHGPDYCQFTIRYSFLVPGTFFCFVLCNEFKTSDFYKAIHDKQEQKYGRCLTIVLGDLLTMPTKNNRKTYG